MRAPGLHELQRLFLDALVEAPETPCAPAGLAGVLRPPARFSIYADMYFWRLREVLAEDYPKLAAALGDEPFTALVRDYVRARPSRHPSVRHAGEGLAEHLATHPGPAWAADLARLEWARIDVFDAPDAPSVGRGDLAGIPPDAWPDLRFEPIPALAVVESAWAIHRLWDDPTTPPDRAPSVLRVWRQDEVVWHTAMAPAEARALGLVRAGAAFGVVCEALDDPADAAAQLARWLDDGLLAAVRLPL
jgi:hypothetical protein